MKRYLKLLFVLVAHAAVAQYAPQAGLTGSTAISASSSQFVGWATGCTVYRGLKNIALPDSGYVTLGDSSMALGPMDHNIVSLGDSGVAVLTFLNPIVDGSGADFAVFENGFLDIANDSLAFLELAFVEVSSDGVNYFRFPSASLTQNTVQLANANYINAADLDNLAGKYISGYGTPFDLEQLSGLSGLDITHVTHVRIVDVIGSVSGHASTDNSGRIINDPYPTTFASGGFDLDAVGVIHQSANAVASVSGPVSFSAWPNPVTNTLNISLHTTDPIGWSAALCDITGAPLRTLSLNRNTTTFLDMASYPAGMYLLVVTDAFGSKWTEKLTKQ